MQSHYIVEAVEPFSRFRPKVYVRCLDVSDAPSIYFVIVDPLFELPEIGDTLIMWAEEILNHNRVSLYRYVGPDGLFIESERATVKQK